MTASELCKMLQSVLLGEVTNAHGCAADKVKVYVNTPDCSICEIERVQYKDGVVLIDVHYTDDYGDN